MKSYLRGILIFLVGAVAGAIALFTYYEWKVMSNRTLGIVLVSLIGLLVILTILLGMWWTDGFTSNTKSTSGKFQFDPSMYGA